MVASDSQFSRSDPLVRSAAVRAGNGVAAPERGAKGGEGGHGLKWEREPIRTRRSSEPPHPPFPAPPTHAHPQGVPRCFVAPQPRRVAAAPPISFPPPPTQECTGRGGGGGGESARGGGAHHGTAAAVRRSRPRRTAKQWRTVCVGARLSRALRFPHFCQLRFVSSSSSG